MNCHGGASGRESTGRVVLVGNPNVGKSSLFAALTGRFVTVSNYPGTTVEIARGTLRLDGVERPVVDTPGLRSLLPRSDDERVARDLLLEPGSDTVVQVADAKNLRRTLLLTAELADAGAAFVLDLNMRDEAESRGITIDEQRLAGILRVPVVTTVAPRGAGVGHLIDALASAHASDVLVSLDPAIERAVARIAPALPPARLSPRSLALAFLVGDDELAGVLGLDDGIASDIADARSTAEAELGEPIASALTRRRLAWIDSILPRVERRVAPGRSIREALGRLAMHRVAGWPILGAVLLAVYAFVGVIGAGTLVGLLEENLFGGVIGPWITELAQDVIPWEIGQRFFVGEYGVVTMGLAYGLAIVLPIVGTFFLALGVLEDSGYLPRLAVVLDRAFRRMGLNGKAVLPMVLGLGCVTMATMTSRILETRKERVQVTLLLALAIPCSAQLGVILGMIGVAGALGVAIWGGIVFATLLAAGYLAARVIPGQPSDFVLELPPMRVPSLGNILVKTLARMEWYLKEVVPLFVAATAVLFLLDETGLLAELERALAPVVVGWLGLPAAATGVLLIGFLRRDYGAAGLFALAGAGALSAEQVLVSLVVITLFVPCFATILMIVREHGARVAAAVVAFVFPFAILVGGLLHIALEAFDVRLG
jgi:ferrous iron transport protein B